MKRKLYQLFLFVSSTIFMFACSQEQELTIDYSFETAINSNHNIHDFNEIKFLPLKNLDLGFHRGNVWIKLSITNAGEYASFVVMTDDLINRNYRFFKLDSINNELIVGTLVSDFTKYDHRTFNNQQPNFEFNLSPNERATFFITTESDGRILQATPKLLRFEDYQSLINKNTVFNILFFVAIGILLFINIFLWTILKNKIYYFYGFYIVSSCLFYLNVEGLLYGYGFTHLAIDHFMFVSIRLWIFSAVLFSAKFLEIDATNPKFYRLIKLLLLVFLVSLTLYQFLFFETSISHLHIIENVFGFVWVVVSFSMIKRSYKKRRLHAKYYLLAFSFLLFFVIIGLLDSHLTLLPGDPFSYFKIGTLIEFSGFTYFIARLIKHNLKKAALLEDELKINQKELSDISKKLQSSLADSSTKPSFDKTELLSVFKLLESSLSNENEWAEFKSKFEALSPYFLINLNQKHSDLSKSEIRLLLLIRIGFTQKEIAAILYIVPDSAKKAKQRVRKKLGLESSTLLNDYLAELSIKMD